MILRCPSEYSAPRSWEATVSAIAVRQKKRHPAMSVPWSSGCNRPPAWPIAGARSPASLYNRFRRTGRNLTSLLRNSDHPPQLLSERGIRQGRDRCWGGGSHSGALIRPVPYHGRLVLESRVSVLGGVQRRRGLGANFATHIRPPPVSANAPDSARRSDRRMALA